MKTIEAIKEIEEEARTWVANDGGLTMAANDILASCEIAKRKIKAGDVAGLKEWVGDPTDCDTGLISDLCFVCLEWAEEI